MENVYNFGNSFDKIACSLDDEQYSVNSDGSSPISVCIDTYKRCHCLPELSLLVAAFKIDTSGNANKPYVCCQCFFLNMR